MGDLTRRTFTTGLAAGGLCLGAGIASGRAIAQSPPDLLFVDPTLRPFAAALLRQTGGMPEMTRATLPAIRQMMDGFYASPLPAPAFRMATVPGTSGAPDVTVYVINSQPGDHRPVIVHTHGGGFVTGSARSSISTLQPIAAALDCVIVTVEYRLAPETNYVGSAADNYAALTWVHGHAEELGVDRNRIAVMGESAGGGHAALLAIMARDRGEVPVMFQALIYPMLDDRTGSVDTPAPPIGMVLWTPVKNRFGWECFLGQAPGTSTVPIQAVPARLADLKGLPPAFIGVGSVDLFMDEDVTYAKRLMDAGVPAQLVTVPGAFHGFDGIAAGTAVAKRFTDAKIEALRRAFQAQRS